MSKHIELYILFYVFVSILLFISCENEDYRSDKYEFEKAMIDCYEEEFGVNLNILIDEWENFLVLNNILEDRFPSSYFKLVNRKNIHEEITEELLRKFKIASLANLPWRLSCSKLASDTSNLKILYEDSRLYEITSKKSKVLDRIVREGDIDRKAMSDFTRNSYLIEDMKYTYYKYMALRPVSSAIAIRISRDDM